MVTYQFRDVSLVFCRLPAGVIHAFGIGFQFLAGRWGDTVVLTSLQMVFQMLYLKGDKGDDLPAKAGVQQVISQGEVQELTLPYHLFGGGLPFIFQSQVVMAEMPDGFRRCLMLNALVVESPFAILLDALRQRPDVAKPAAMDIDEVEKLTVVFHLLHGTLDSFLKADAL